MLCGARGRGGAYSLVRQQTSPSLSGLAHESRNLSDGHRVNCILKSMASYVREADVHEILELNHVWYEVRTYYVLLERRPVGSPPLDQRIPAGFDVDLYGALEKMQLPFSHREEGLKVVDYFRAVAQELQAKAEKDGTRIEVMTDPDSLTLDTHRQFQPEVLLRIRITHDRGLDQPGGPSEEEALKGIQEVLHELGVKRA
jgi:hypothetical protein